MTEDIEEIQIIEIHPGCKYVLQIDENITQTDLDQILSQLRSWWNDIDDPFLVLNGNVELVKIRGENEE